MAKRKARRKKIVTERKREFRYRGLTPEHLNKMTTDDMIPLLTSRMRRSLKRGLSEGHQKFWAQVETRDYIETHHRNIIILPKLVGKKVGIYNGKEFKAVEITPEMVGHYLGEFALTRKSVKHTGPGVGATRSSKFLPLK